eukprot:jgi/Chlat1/4792/Chrsp31S04780
MKALSTVSSGLRLVAEQHAARGRRLAEGPVVHSHGLGEKHVVVNLVAKYDTDLLLDELVPLSFELSGRHGLHINGVLPKSVILLLDTLDHLQHADRSYPTRRAQGIAATAGDQAIYADVIRQQYQVTGAGTKILVLSDSFNSLQGLHADQFTADLPSGDSSVVVLRELSSTIAGRDEGRAMLQIVYDVAPGAQLYFFSGYEGPLSIVSAVDQIVAAGINVIVDDLGFYEEPFFMDGALAQAANTLFAQGVVWYSAAGNDAGNSWEVACPNGCTFGGPSSAYAFSAGVYRQAISVCYSCTVSIAFQWDEPFSSATNGVGPKNDVNIAIFATAETATPLASSTDNNVVSGRAFELVTYQCQPAQNIACTIYLQITLAAGAAPKRMKYILVSSGGQSAPIDTRNWGAGTVFGHPNSASALAVGAVDYKDTPAFGTCPPVLASFSSIGGVPILFGNDGTRLAQPILRQKPDLVGPSGVDVSFFSPGVTADILPPCGRPTFVGTSAAAPHLAAAAALFRGVYPSATAPLLSAAMRSSSINIGISGFDFLSGFGLADALAALAKVDADSDRVPDSKDKCPGTPLGQVVNLDGCSISQLCPCARQTTGNCWRMRNDYAMCVDTVAKAFSQSGLISQIIQKQLSKAAKDSNCGGDSSCKDCWRGSSRNGRKGERCCDDYNYRCNNNNGDNNNYYSGTGRNLLQACGGSTAICPPIPDGYVIITGTLTIILANPLQVLDIPFVDAQISAALAAVISPYASNFTVRATANYAIRRAEAPVTAKYFIVVPSILLGPKLVQVLIAASDGTGPLSLTQAVNNQGLRVISVVSSTPVVDFSDDIPAFRTPATQRVWTPLAAQLAAPTSSYAGGASAQLGDYVVLAGGSGASASAPVQLLNLATGDIFLQPPMPTPVASAASASMQVGTFSYYMFTGGLSTSNAPARVFQLLKVDANGNSRWLTGARMTCDRAGHAMYTIGKKICVLGPVSVQPKVECIDISAYDTKWAFLPAAASSRIPEFNGMYAQAGDYTYFFTPAATWRRQTSRDAAGYTAIEQSFVGMPTPRIKAAVTYVLTTDGPMILVAGGELVNQPGVATNVVEALKLGCTSSSPCLSWSAFQPLVAKRTSFQFGVLSNRTLYALGGSIDGQSTSSQEAYLF